MKLQTVAMLLMFGMSLLSMGCAVRPYRVAVAKMPPCTGVWLSPNGGASYTCTSPVEFERWRQRNGL